MKSLSDIRRQPAIGEFEFSRHALRRVVDIFGNDATATMEIKL